MKKMTEAEMAEYENKEPIAVYPVSNCGGIEILDVLYGIDDYVVCRYNFGEPEKKLHRVKVKYKGTGLPYVYIDGTQIALGDCIRV